MPNLQATAHTSKSFDDDLHRLRVSIAQMGGLAEAQIIAAIDALTRRDPDAAAKVVAGDAAIDRAEVEAERLAIAFIARNSPLADDLREVVAALKIAAVLERIGDYARNIAKRAAPLSHSAVIQPAVIVPEMAKLVARMLRDALDAYVDRDAELAISVCVADRAVDDFYSSLFRSLLTYMMENPHHITPSTHLLFVAKNLERMGDHATNIAEMVHFSVTGAHIGSRPKSDDTALFESAPNIDDGGPPA